MGEYSDVAEAAERQKETGTSRWMPILAAAVAVLAALATMMSNSRANQAIIAKNQAIVSFTRASDTYNYYQAKSIKEEVYNATVIGHGGSLPPAEAVAKHEHDTKQAVLSKAMALEKEAAEEDQLSERYVHSYETLEVGVAFLEVAVVVFSISSLLRGLVLPAIAACSALVGIGYAISGLPY
ncbi:MAG: DUF4337 family protein [Vulcanimicrobiaceae bacterium]